MVQSITWNWNGSLMATSCKDKELRIFDPRSGKIVSHALSHDGAKGFKTVWLGNKNKLITVGQSKTSNREICYWDVNNLTKPLSTVSIDQGTGLITPYYDSDTGVAFLAGKGDGNIKLFELTDDDPYIHFLTEYRSMIPAQGVAILPKTSCNVRECEIGRFLKLAPEYVESLSFKVPRTRMELFQDDIFPPTKKVEATLNAEEWFGGKNKDPVTISLRPSDMKTLSEAPVEQKVQKYSTQEELEKDTRDIKDKVLGSYYTKMGTMKEEQNQPLKQDLMEGANDEEWN